MGWAGESEYGRQYFAIVNAVEKNGRGSFYAGTRH